nr:hypothetical protein [Campylobacter cuniculorum]
MNTLDIIELIFIALVVFIGFGGMVYVILDKKKK